MRIICVLLGLNSRRLLDFEHRENMNVSNIQGTVINALNSSSGGIPIGLFIGVVRGLIIMSKYPLTTLVT
jgi:NhaP-type Na+/H+ or K+/H+ antiporter